MLQRRDLFGPGFPAGGAGVGADAGLFFGGLPGHGALVPAVAGGGDDGLGGDGGAAAAAVAAVGETFLGAGGGIAFIGDGVMAQRRDGSFVTVTAFAAGMGSRAFFQTEGFPGHGFCVAVVTCIGGVIRGGHGVNPVEFGGFILIITGVPYEGVGAAEEPAVIGYAGIPCGVKIVVILVDSCNVPAMGAATVTGNQPGIHTQFQRKPVEQQSITLTDSGFVEHGSIGGMLQLVAVVFKIVVVIGDIGADIIIDAADDLILGAVLNIQLVDDFVDSAVHFRFLTGGGVVSHIEGNVPVDTAVIGVVTLSTIAIAPSAVLPAEVITFCGNAGVGDSRREGVADHSLQRILLGIRHIDVEHDGILSVFHTFPDLQCQNFKGIGIVSGSGPGQGGKYKVGFRERILIEGVNMGVRDRQSLRLRPNGSAGKDAAKKYRQGKGEGKCFAQHKIPPEYFPRICFLADSDGLYFLYYNKVDPVLQEAKKSYPRIADMPWAKNGKM